ncbi:MAG: glycine cleavage system aminomethyltransferase GcvT [Firmicutes bacterium]|nr:glycine cleavage system aminomethyltransferase GcvT [Bacillota bacterium]
MKQTPLTAVHRALGAKMVDFAGFEMPVQYAGVIEEHLTVRRAVGLFDLCHMGEFDLEGPGALAVLSKLTTNDPAALQEGDIQYTMLTKPDGGIIDDILVYRTATGFFLVVNAANTAKDFAWIKEHLTPDATLQDRSSELALLAVQGPKSLPVVEKVLGLSLADLGSYTFLDTTYKDLPLRISRTGYTGEDGFELYLPNAGAEPLWEDLMAAGGDYGIAPIGLGARDTLRLEMRMPLYGNDIDETTTPLEAGLGRFVKFDKGDFLGRDALLAQKEAGVPRRLVAFVMAQRGIPRHGYPLFDEAGDEIGHVTSGTLSPSLNQPIGTGYVKAELAAPGTTIFVGIRQKRLQAQIIKGRFLK